MTAARFLAVFCASLALVAAAIAGFTVTIDPYLVFDSPRWPGLNASKPAVESHEPLMKAHQSVRVLARTVIIGSSRADIGLDPASAAWPQALQPVYNLSLIGGDTSTGLLFLQNMLRAGREGGEAKALVIGLDFEFFLARPPAGTPAPAAAQGLLDSPAPGQQQRVAVLADGGAGAPRVPWKDYLSATLSLDAIADSVWTIYANRDASPQSDLAADGHYSEGQYRNEIGRVGAAALFLRQDEGTLRQYRCPARDFDRSPDGAGDNLAAVRRLLVLAHERGVRVYLAILPSHAQHLDLLGQLGYWQGFEDWKRALVALTAQADANGTDVRLWDFAGYEPYATERIPALGDRTTRLRWFWDSVHPTSALGDIMLARMLEHPEAPNGYGALLTPETIEARLARVRQDREVYRLHSPDQAQQAARMITALPPCAARDPLALVRTR